MFHGRFITSHSLVPGAGLLLVLWATMPAQGEVNELPRSMPAVELLAPEPVVVGEGEMVVGPMVVEDDDPFACWPQERWDWHLLPNGLIWHAYLAGRESRMASVWAYERDQGWIWDITLGGRAGILRYGTSSDSQPEGWQLDLEGAAFPRLDIEQDRDLISTDFRFGVPLTYGQGPFQSKFGYYHLSAHLGDELMIREPDTRRINYGRDVLIFAVAWFIVPDVRVYAETGWAFSAYGGSEPWEFQFGADYSPLEPTDLRGAPFLAINGTMRQESGFGGRVIAQAGWQWRGPNSGSRFRLGFQYFNGQSDQFEFYDQHEEQYAGALWYDF